MAQVRPDKLSIYVPKENLDERLQKLARQKDRSVNYLVVQAILYFSLVQFQGCMPLSASCPE